ncbi:MAG: hypothetical protein H7301_04620 [Cryobacterium sp.]|nr:hypothetical protein [Oligoflexia bacterium]
MAFSNRKTSRCKSNSRLTLSLMTVLFTASFISVNASAALPSDLTYSLEPIVGYEFQKKENPSRRVRVFTYGGRIIAGYKILSAEGEYTLGNSNETFASSSTQIEEKRQTARIGLRSTYSLGSVIDWYLRGGAENQKRHTTTTVSGVITENDSPSKVYPYVGTGVSLKIGMQLSLNASVIATVKDTKDLNQNEYTTTLGVNLNFNTR